MSNGLPDPLITPDNWAGVQRNFDALGVLVSPVGVATTLPAAGTVPEGFRVYYKAGTGCVWTLTYLPTALGSTYPWKVDGPALQVFHGSATGVTTTTLNNVGGTFSAPLSGIYDYELYCGLMRQNANIISFLGAQVDKAGPTTIISSRSQLAASSGGAGGPVSVRDHTITLLTTDVLQAKQQMVSGTNADFFSMTSFLTPNQVG